MPGCRIIRDLKYKETETVVLENSLVRIVILVGKGGDILEFRDKRADVNVLYETDHEWRTPNESFASPTGNNWFDYYPGGWQDVLPFTQGETHMGADYGLHGESCLIPWEVTGVEETKSQVTLELEAELTRYPFEVTKRISLEEDSSVMTVDESVTNTSEVPLEYMWVQHVALGKPLVAPGASIEVPAGNAVTFDSVSENSVIRENTNFDWPNVETKTGEQLDISRVPEDRRHDVAYLTDLEDGWYGVTNDDIDLGFGLVFDKSLFECIWLWQAYGGFEVSPYFNRSWNLGVEPATGYPGWDFPNAAEENGTVDTLQGGATVETSYKATTYRNESELMEI